MDKTENANSPAAPLNRDDTNDTRSSSITPPAPRARRRPGKDSLLGDDPPRFLTLAIVLIAVMLTTLAAVCWSFEYEETIPIALEPAAEPLAGYAVGYIPASVDVRAGQKVHLPRGSMPAATDGAESTVTEVSGPTKEGLYIVRVDLPENAREPGAAPTGQPNNGGSINGVLVTKRIRLFAKLFSVFRNITRAS